MKTYAGLVLVLMLTGCAMVQDGAIDLAQKYISEKKYDVALRNLGEACRAGKPAPEVMAEIDYLRGVSYAGLGKKVEAVAYFQYVAAKFPDSEYGYLAGLKARLSWPMSCRNNFSWPAPGLTTVFRL
jgi:tetratricopeptide (TPR) repeat protein